MRAWCRNRRFSVLLLVATACIAACGGQPREAAEREPPWDPVEWRQRLEAHAAATARMLPMLAAAAGAEDPGAHRDTLRAIYAALQDAEESIPPAPWGIDLADAELHSKYRSAVRELRYGAEVMLDGVSRDDESRREEARYFIAQGMRHFQTVRAEMEREPQEVLDDTSTTVEPPSASP